MISFRPTELSGKVFEKLFVLFLGDFIAEGRANQVLVGKLLSIGPVTVKSINLDVRIRWNAVKHLCMRFRELKFE